MPLKKYHTEKYPIMSTNETTTAIIGAGPAGLAAAIQLRRYGIPFILFEKERMGGLLWNANLVENYPGFPDGVSGPALAALFERQSRRLGIDVTFEVVRRLDVEGETFHLETARGGYHPQTVIVASGTKPLPFPCAIPPEASVRVFSEVYPLLDIQHAHIVIVGAGDAAFDYALNLAKKRNSVTILNRGRKVKCLSLLKERAAAQALITYRAGMRVGRVEVSETANRLRLSLMRRVKQSSEQIVSECDYLIFAIGRCPQEDFLSESLRAQEQALISAGRLYFVGDVRNGLLRQTAIAAGEGLRAAMQICARWEGKAE